MADKTPSWMPKLFFCHRYEFCVVADQLGFGLGTRADQFQTNSTQQLLDEGFSVELVDNDFENPDPDRLHTVVEKTDASYVVLPDVYDPSEVEDVLGLGRVMVELYDTTPIVVPKCEFNHDKVPDDWMLGFSVPSGYAETEIPVSSFSTHRTHLLGGSPRNQIRYANKAVDAGVEIFSADGNSFAKASTYGNIINEPVEMLSTDGQSLDGKAWVSDADGYTDWGQRIAQSLGRYYELWRQWALRRGYAGDVSVTNNV